MCATTLSTREVSPSLDPTCKAAPSETCQDSCKLLASICDASERICRIAGDLAGADRYANENCASGKASCKASREKCCGCV